VAGWAWSTHATVSASQQQTLSGTGARVYTLKGLHTGAGSLGVVTSIRLIGLHITAAATAERYGGFELPNCFRNNVNASLVLISKVSPATLDLYRRFTGPSVNP